MVDKFLTNNERKIIGDDFADKNFGSKKCLIDLYLK